MQTVDINNWNLNNPSIIKQAVHATYTIHTLIILFASLATAQNYNHYHSTVFAFTKRRYKNSVPYSKQVELVNILDTPFDAIARNKFEIYLYILHRFLDGHDNNRPLQRRLMQRAQTRLLIFAIVRSLCLRCIERRKLRTGQRRVAAGGGTRILPRRTLSSFSASLKSVSNLSVARRLFIRRLGDLA